MDERRLIEAAAAEWSAAATGVPGRAEAARLLAGAGCAVLVEGASDAAAILALAARRERDLAADGTVVVAMGGATRTGRFAELLGPHGLGLGLAGLYDVGEASGVCRALARAGVEADGFHVCDVDLEDELIRALGAPAVEQLLIANREGRSWRTFQRQPVQRSWTLERQLHRFMGTRGGRKIHFARVLVQALELDRVPAPLDAVLASAGSAGQRYRRP